MLRYLLVFISILLSFEPGCFSQTSDNDNTLRELVKRDGQVEVTIPFTDRSSVKALTINVSIVSIREKAINIRLSPLTVEWFIHQRFDYFIAENTGNKGVVSAKDVSEAWNWETYPTYTQYDSIMQSFITNYPDLCLLDTIGTSINGKLVLALKISDQPSLNEEEPEVFYTSTIHGDETGGYILMLRLIDYLLKNYNLDNRVRNLVDNLEIWINPLANPDGTYNNGDIITTPTRFNANGYDLNRNFPDLFTPFTIKQKETLAMMKFLRKHRFILSANFHSGAEVVNYPWDRWYDKLHADDGWFYNISRAYADTVHNYSVSSYMNFLDNGVTRGAEWYIIYGGRQDFVTYELQGREVTIELDDNFITPAAQLSLLWQNNWHSLLGYLENALYGIHGVVLDSKTEEPVAAKVLISGHDKDSSHIYSDTLTGRFVRLLEPGIWNMTFSASGYKDTTFTDLSVFSGLKTEIIVTLSPLTSGIDTTIPVMPTLYPNPAASIIRAILPEGMEGQMNIKIINQLGMVINDFSSEVFRGIPFEIDIRYLDPGVYTAIFIIPEKKVSCRARFVVIK